MILKVKLSKVWIPFMLQSRGVSAAKAAFVISGGGIGILVDTGEVLYENLICLSRWGGLLEALCVTAPGPRGHYPSW